MQNQAEFPRTRDSLQVQGLWCAYNGVQAVSDVSLALTDSKVYGLIGPNGSGKTTLLKTMAGLLSPIQGKVRLGPVDLTRLSPSKHVQRGIAYMFQEPRLFLGMTCRDNLEAASLSPHRDRTFLDELLLLTDLRQYADADAETLSHGQSRLLQLCRTLACRPKFALLDEPASGVNPLVREVIIHLVRWITEHQDVSILIVEHDMDFVRAACKEIFALSEGKLIARGEPNSVLSNKKVIDAYFG